MFRFKFVPYAGESLYLVVKVSQLFSFSEERVKLLTYVLVLSNYQSILRYCKTQSTNVEISKAIQRCCKKKLYKVTE